MRRTVPDSNASPGAVKPHRPLVSSNCGEFLRWLEVSSDLVEIRGIEVAGDLVNDHMPFVHKFLDHVVLNANAPQLRLTSFLCVRVHGSWAVAK